MDDPHDDGLSQDLLLRDLAALDRAGTAWLALIARAAEEGAGPDWCWRAQSGLARLLWHLYRAEDAFAAWSAAAPLPTEEPAHLPPVDDRFTFWRERLDRIIAGAALPAVHRRAEHPLDPDDEAVTVDIVTDLALVCATIETATPALRRVERLRLPYDLDLLAFLAVLGPWRARGATAATVSLCWLQAVRTEQDPW